jgi:arylsulfatase A-like enzyme
MRILYIDVDSLRPDHLGCYGYHRNTSPNIDRIAGEGVRFENNYVTDAPCLPSRTALWSGRFGIHTGVINHGGVAADPFIEGRDRQFHSTLGRTSWMRCLRDIGYHTATISPFGERHSAWHWYANFSEVHNTGKGGQERAHEVTPVALKWMEDNAKKDNWFLHLNYWDPHTPYRTPTEYGNPFKNDPLPKWLTEDVRQKHWVGCGPHSAREIPGYVDKVDWLKGFDLQPSQASSMEEVRRMFDGYDIGVRYADDGIGQVLRALEQQGVLDETVIIVSADHGENLGELNIYGDHQTADHITSRVPLIVRWPGITKPRVDTALHYHFDFAATMIELVGGKVPEVWDGRPFTSAFKSGQQQGRDYLVVSQGAWSCQRSVRFDDYICIRSYHDGHHGFPERMLFNVKNDPHEQTDLACDKPDLVNRAMDLLDQWHAEMMRTTTTPTDPMWTVLREGGPYHTRGNLKTYLTRLRDSGRAKLADELAARYPQEVK